MRHLKTYDLYKKLDIESIISDFITHISKMWDLRFGKPFDEYKANCAWYTIEFYNFAKQRSLDVRVIYFDSDIEAHIAPILGDKVIDFTVKQFTKNPDDNYLVLTPEDYKQFGYHQFEVYDELPELETVHPADRI